MKKNTLSLIFIGMILYFAWIAQAETQTKGYVDQKYKFSFHLGPWIVSDT